MRSIRWLAAVTGTLALGTACGGGESTPPPENQAPVASFSEVCTNLSCVFTDASTDPDGNATITGRSWTFGDQSAASNETNPTHAYTAAGTYVVTLTVTDNEGAQSAAFSKNVTVTAAPPANLPPVANFEPPIDCVAGTPCGFHSTSTDPDGDIAGATFAWNFGDAGTGTGADATHTFATANTYSVKLDVTDVAGGTATVTKAVVVSPAASQDCTTSGRTATCTLTPSARVTLKIRIVSTNCELSGNKIEVTAPQQQTAFFNLCNRTAGEEWTVLNAANGDRFEAGAPITLKFTGGNPGTGDPAAGDAGIQIDGGYPNWTLNIDDGGAAGTGGEPDFDDVVLAVQATLAP